MDQIIYQSQITSPEVLVNLNHVSKGIYFVKLTDDNKNVLSGKIIIQEEN